MSVYEPSRMVKRANIWVECKNILPRSKFMSRSVWLHRNVRRQTANCFPRRNPHPVSLAMDCTISSCVQVVHHPTSIFARRADYQNKAFKPTWTPKDCPAWFPSSKSALSVWAGWADDMLSISSTKFPGPVCYARALPWHLTWCGQMSIWFLTMSA